MLFIDFVLDIMAFHQLYISFLDGYSGYNQFSIRKQDREKMTFTIDWGTFTFNVIPFGLCNAQDTFQRVMMIIFQEYLWYFLEIFIDNFCVCSSDALGEAHPQ